MQINTPSPYSYWVVPGRFLAGPYPGPDILQALLDAGIRQFISLMEPIELNWDGRPFPPYEDRVKTLADEMGVAVAFNRMPIRDMSVPTDGHMEKILDRVDAAIQEDRPVYIHCLGGRGRTGTVVGCYLARHGHAKSLRALDRINTLRRDTENRHHPSPETPEQVNMVLRWR